jgi:opacity protein-like surface antigen
MLGNWALRASVLAIACAAGPLLSASESQAADVYDGSLKDPVPAYAPASSSTWSGPYIGGHLGGGWGGDGRSVTVSGGDGGGGGGGGGDNNWTGGTGNKANIDGAAGESGNAGGDGGRGGNRSLAAIPPNADRRLGGTGGDGGAGGSVTGDTGDDDGFVGGLNLGYNWQSGSLVLGVEGDVSMNGGLDDYLASLRARIGLARGNTLFYATGGIAYRDSDGSGALGLATNGGAGGRGGDNDDRVDDPGAELGQLLNRGGQGGAGGAGGTASGAGSFSDDDGGQSGFVIGGGVEMKLASNVSFGIEGLWYSFDDDASGDDDLAVVRARLTFHLNRGDEDASLKDGFASATVANWAGFYAGANAGAAFRDGNHVDSIKTANGGAGETGGNGELGNVPGGVPRTEGIDDPGGAGGGGGGGAAALVNYDDNAGFLGGLHLGYNWQNGSRVFGIEGDVDFADGSYADYLASVRLRLGYSFDRVLVYGTAGVAFAGGSGTQSVSLSSGGSGGNGQHGSNENHPTLGGGDGGARGAGGTATVSSGGGDDKVGFVAGAGLEYKVTERMSFGLEGLYYAFDGKDGSSSATSFTGDDDLSSAVVRARVTIHLNGEHEALK